jgi:hypothetical protein
LIYYFAMLFALHRTWTRSRIVVMAAMLVLAQLGIVTHAHSDTTQQGQSVELSCAFCIAGTHLQSGPAAPIFHAPQRITTVFVADVRHVCAVRCLVSPRLTRGPPRSTTCL